MKCNEVNMIEYMEGLAPKEAVRHVEACRKCQERSADLQGFSRLISTRYREGKLLEKELQGRLASMDLAKMKPLPADLREKIKDLREKKIMARVRTVIGKGRKNVEELMDGLMSPGLKAVPASPKDITKPKKTKKKKNVPKK